MGMVVRTNTNSNNAYRQLGMNNTQLSKSLEKLSSGFRINRAGDDSSGLAISEKMKAQISGLDQASANSQDGISLVQTAEGALTEVHSMLNRMVTLADKSANGTIQNNVDRDAIQTEINALKEEITRVSKSTNFNGIALLDGSLGGARTGALSTATTSVAGSTVGTIAATVASTTAVIGAPTANSTEYTLTVNYNDKDGKAQTAQVKYTSGTDDATTNTNIATAINGNDTLKALFKASASTTTLKVSSLTTGATAPKVTSFSTTDAKGAAAVAAGTPTAGTNSSSSIKLGANMANGDTITLGDKVYEKVANAGDSTTTTGAIGFNDAAALVTAAGKNGVSVTAADLNQNTTITASYNGTGSAGLVLQVGDTNDSYNKVTVSIADMSAEGLGIANLDVSTQDAAGAAINTIKTAINQVSTNRGNLGALQNRLEHAISNLDTTSENMNSANSAIRDTDMAKEMMNYTKMNILSQAAQAMLAQANQQPQNILQLLK